MLSKILEKTIDYVEKNPEKAQDVVNKINKAWENRALLIAGKDTLVKGIAGVEESLLSVGSLLKFKFSKKEKE